jgi:hypothetical protein
MRLDTIARRSGARSTTALLSSVILVSAACSSATQVGTSSAATAAGAPTRTYSASADPRVDLGGGWRDAKEAISNLTMVAHVQRPSGFFDASDPGDFSFVNSDLAFRGNYVFQGNYHGFQVWDISNPSHPTIRTAFVCPGGQGDVSVYHTLLFVSVEETSARLDCGTQGVGETVSPERFRGVRIFDISDIDHPKQVADVQTCRGSHTHTLVTDPNDPDIVYIYVQGTSPSRPAAELAGCYGDASVNDPNDPYFRIEVIKVPVAAPQNAAVVNTPRIFADSTGNFNGLWNGGNHGNGTQTTSQTNQCHDITAYMAIGLAAGACSGNGILLDISDPANPKRVAAVNDPNFAYWHSATFTNDGSMVLFTDEWGGGTRPRCQATDPHDWGADAIFSLTGHTLTQKGYYKLPAPQDSTQNCVAHNGSLVPVPGRDIMVQAWYQGGVSVFDFTDPAHPKEIAYFDRGPMDASKLVLGGYWSAYWYNGHIYGSEIGRGLDVFQLKPSESLSQNEIDAARLVHVDQLNVQNQQKIVWPASFSVARAYLDQLVRGKGISSERATAIAKALDSAQKMSGQEQRTALTTLAAQLEQDAGSAADGARVRAMASAVKKMAGPTS